jgi:hypothetical protein
MKNKNPGYLTTETRSTLRKTFFMKKYSELRDLCASAVKKNPDHLTTETRRTQRKRQF